MEIELADFDAEFFGSLEDHDKIRVDSRGVYHVILADGEKAGVVGYIPVISDEKTGFVQIVLAKKYKGKGILKMAEDLLAKIYGLETLYATVEEGNIASIKGHMKAGFEILEESRIETLRKKGFLKENEIRLVKNY